MPKRSNESSQVRREDYEAEEERGERKDPGTGFSRASDDILRKRRIIRTPKSGGKSGGALRRSMTPSKTMGEAAVSGGAASGASGIAAGSGENPKSGSNPFAKISFASGKKESTAASFSFGTPSKQQTSAPTTTATTSTTPKSKKRKLKERALKLSKYLLSRIEFEAKANPLSSWKPWIREGRAYARGIRLTYEAASMESPSSHLPTTTTKPSPSPPTATKFTSPSTGCSVDTKTPSSADSEPTLKTGNFAGFTFPSSSSSLAAPSTKSFTSTPKTTNDDHNETETENTENPKTPNANLVPSTTTPSIKTPTFSFGTSSSATPTFSVNTPASTFASPSTGFFFGKPATPSTAEPKSKSNFGGLTFPPSSSATTPSSQTLTSTPKTTKDDDSKNDQEATKEPKNNEETPKNPDAIIPQETNPDEQCTYEIRSKYMKKQKGGGWTAFSPGPLRLYRNKHNPNSNRLVLRDDIGKPQLNVNIFKGMNFDLQQRNKNVFYVIFVAIQDQTIGLETFALMVKGEDNGKTLQQKLMDLVPSEDDAGATK